jgi:hypothetical protein
MPPLRSGANWLARESAGVLTKEFLKIALFSVAAIFVSWFLAAVNQLFRLETPITVDNFWSQLQSFILTAWHNPFDYTVGLYARDPLHSIIALIVAIIFVLVVVLFRRVKRRIRTLAGNLQEAAVSQALVSQIGIGGRWPNAKDGSEAPWPELCKEIRRSDNSVLDILGANGVETFGEPGSPLYELLNTFTGTIRVILLHPTGDATTGRAQSVGSNIRAYRKSILTSQRRLRDLKKQHRPVDGRFYNGQPNWKLIITSRTAWVQYYMPTGLHVNATPMYRLDATEDGSDLFHIFHLEFDRIWNRCADFPMKLT